MGTTLKVNPMAMLQPKIAFDGVEGASSDPSKAKMKTAGRKGVKGKAKQSNKKSEGIKKPQRALRASSRRVTAPPPAPDTDDDLEDEIDSCSDNEGVSVYSE